MSRFGTFVDLCEAKGMKVVLDRVVNHAGYGAEGQFSPSWFNVGGSGDVKGELAGLPDFDHDNYPDVCLIGELLFEGKEDVGKLLEYQNYHDFDSTCDFPLCTALRSTFIYDEGLRYWLARPRLNEEEPRGVLDEDNLVYWHQWYFPSKDYCHSKKDLRKQKLRWHVGQLAPTLMMINFLLARVSFLDEARRQNVGLAPAWPGRCEELQDHPASTCQPIRGCR